MIGKPVYISIPPHKWTIIEGFISDKKTDEVDKMLEDCQHSPRKPSWIFDLPEGEGALAISWKGQLLIRGPQ